MNDPIRAAIQDELQRAKRARLENDFRTANRHQHNAEKWSREQGIDLRELGEQQTAHP